MTKLKNCIAIASSSRYRTGLAGSLSTYLIPIVDKNPELSIGSLIKMTNDYLIGRCFPTFITYYSDEKLGDELFLPDSYVQILSLNK